MKPVLFLLAMSCFCCGAQVTTPKKQPLITQNSGKPDFGVALSFINAYIRQLLSNDKKKPLEATWIKTNTLLTPAFKAKYKAICDSADPEFGLEADPILSAQDFPDKGFVISKTDPVKGYVTMSGVGWKEFKVILKVVQINNKWLVDGSGIVNIPESKQIKL